MNLKKIDPKTLVPMDTFVADEAIAIDLVYAQENHEENIFGKIYHDNARLWCQYDLACIVILASRKLNVQNGWTLVLKDSLRTVEAQEKMQESDIVKAHPEWLEQPSPMLSKPGLRGHPRGMAIDVSVENIDMGTVFDDMSKASDRSYKDFPQVILENRQKLEQAFLDSARELELEILPLPNEWWDFRFPASYSETFAPIHDRDLPPQMRMASTDGLDIPDFDQSHFENLKNNILSRLN
ncbi:MAG: D-Ala-D-Ala dipeptidase [Alphaproteobacteria bacterium]|nr:D-Ala-D-Ala dipeptidase [Alphaproteobacteria bacterium]